MDGLAYQLLELGAYFGLFCLFGGVVGVFSLLLSTPNNDRGRF